MSYLVGALIIGAIIFFVVKRGFQMKNLCHKGVPVEGKVIKKFRQQGKGMSSPCLRYEFHSAGGQRIENKITVAEEIWDAHEEGSPIDIVYLEDKPAVNAAKHMVNLSREALKLPPL
jgi:hypothetical protein